jgi:hypothetical protein
MYDKNRESVLRWTSFTAKDGTRKSTLAVMARIVQRLILVAVEAMV